MTGEKGRAEWLTEASLLLAVLFLGTLSRAILSGARLGLSGLVLRVSGEEDAVPAHPNLADLRMADPSDANLEGAEGWTVEQLTSTMSPC